MHLIVWIYLIEDYNLKKKNNNPQHYNKKKIVTFNLLLNIFNKSLAILVFNTKYDQLKF